MSSAALHPPSHQQHSLPAQSPPTSAYQYSSAQSPNAEGYHASRDNHSASSPSSRHPSRRPSATHSSQPSQSSPMNPAPSSNHAASTSDHERSSSRRRNDPPIAPPRTSSSHHSASNPAPSASSSRRTARAEDRAAGNSPRQAPAESASNSASSNSTVTTNNNSGRAAVSSRSESTRMGADDPSSRSRRAASTHVSATTEPSQRPSSSSNREHRQTVTTTMPIRSHPAASSKQPSREASEVLNRVIVSQPEDDLARERERLDEAQPQAHQATAPPSTSTSAAHDGQDDPRRHRSRQDYSKREKTSKFGDYYLGNTIGEGEFGKVKLGWKQDGGVQVAIKLIRRDSVGNNPSRLAKIYREVSILRGISHPNIVRLHEMSETERHIGIVLEYASGGELFDYILNHRYLKDHAARRLFAQLVSGVGYLHKKGIVHRDLKLENLLLDRNRNIIITDFGFANTFDPNDELSEEQELSLADREYVKRNGLDKTKSNGMRRGDLMQTSCGSPCYAAPELVVSDSLYTGRKVDVWSCGVILYAMLAGYLPFDDDPANPEGDNINLLYKYIVNTPLTFPEYVTPHARDLLRRILVPSPRKRADLFEVARHSWLSEYAHVVELITSTTTTSSEIQYTTVPAEDTENGGLARSASVREPSKTKPAASGADAGKKGGVEDSSSPKQRDSKRRTVQVEYVAPTTQTQRGESAQAQSSSRSKTKGRSSSQGPAESRNSPTEKALPKDPPGGREAYTDLPSQRKPPQSHRNQASTSSRTPTRVPSEATHSGGSAARPATGGSLNSSQSRGLATRASYGQPLPPAVADTNAHGRIQQPKAGSKNYVISNPIPQDSQDPDGARPSSSVPSKFAQVSGFDQQDQTQAQDHAQAAGHNRQSSGGKGHKRSNTLGEISDKIFGRRGSIFGGRKKAPLSPSSPSEPGTNSQPAPGEKSRKYPPISMANNMSSGEGRASIDSRASRRSFSMGLNKKPSGSVSGSQGSGERTHNRRFSLLKAVGLSRESGTPPPDGSQQDLPIQDPPQVDEFGRYVEQPSNSRYGDEQQQQPRDQQRLQSAPHPERTSTRSRHQRFASTSSRPTAIPQYMQQEAVLNSGSESSFDQSQPQRKPPNSAQYQGGYDSDQYDQRNSAGSRNRVLQKNKRFTDAYDEDEYGRTHDHAGSSGAAKRVMDFFRRRGRARGGEVA